MDAREDNNRNNQNRGRNDRPRGFPPPPNRRSKESKPLPPRQNVERPWRESGNPPDDLSNHPAFQSSDGTGASSGSGYIPPGQEPSSYTHSQSEHSGPPHSPDNWGSEARFAPPSARPPERYPSEQSTYYGNSDSRSGHNQPPLGQPEAYSPPQRYGDALPQRYEEAPPQRYGDTLPQRYENASPAYGAPRRPEPYPHRSHPGPGSPSEAPKRSSVGKTILKIVGWTLLLSVILIALVLGGGWLGLRNAASQFLNPGTQQTFITKGPVVASLKQVNKQIMIEHNNMVDVDYREAPEGWLSVLPIEQSFVVLLRGRVPAGFDLSDLNEDDVWISSDGTKIQLILPPPVIFEDNVAVNFEESRVISEGDSCPDFICAQDLEAIQQVIIPQGRQLLIETSENSGIMEQAAELGINYYESLLQSLGFEEIQVFIRSDVEIIQQTE